VSSASPEFLIRPACAKLGIGCVMGSPVDKHTGHFYGPNCHGQEKVKRFHARFPGAKIEEFYSDSHSDDPLAALAERAYLVSGEQLLPW
jgi:phosphoserine phosphatase